MSAGRTAEPAEPVEPAERFVPDDDGRVWTPARRGLAAGLVLTITMLAFESLGVSTAMPVVARDLHGVELYGWAFSALMLGSLIGVSVAGTRVDRHGPGMPLLAGLVLFALGLAAAGSAPSMAFLVGARFVQGLGVGAVPAVAYAAIGRVFDERARARMFALLSTAWVVPGLIGPAISGAVAEGIGWRWVFFGVLPLVPITALLAGPPLVRLGPPPADPAGASVEVASASHRTTILLAIGLAAAVAVAVAGLNAGRLATLPLAAVGFAAMVVPLRRLLPLGTFRAAAGIPAAVATRGVHAFAFFGTEAFLPLALTSLRHQRAAVAGLVLTASTLTWTTGAWLQDRRGHVWGRKTMVRRGLVALVFGVASTSAVLVPAVPVVILALTWSIAGLGMGMAYSGLSLVVLGAAPPGQEGRASSALQLSEQLSIALGIGIAGAAVAVAERVGHLRVGIAVAFAMAALSGVAAIIASSRLPALPSSPSGPQPEQFVAAPHGLVPDALDP